jgi:hypothetical protein
MRSLIRAVFFLCLLGSTGPLLRAEWINAIHISSPLMLSGSAGLRFGDDPVLKNSLEVEAGVGGGKILLGLDSIGSGVGYGLKAVLMRTWLEPIGVDDDQLYLGAEAQLGLGSFYGSLGGYRRIEGDDDSWLASIGIGMRF